ncbi:MAG TPA: fused MFS/spermidine synthase [Vicinamibacterales bacterium]|nr:fused MFS/spermidine synthase [Vicinamibacterales bacterium]
MLDRRWFYAIYALSGGAALIYEVTWTRLLTLHMGHTVAAASTVLAAFMGGLGIGAWIGGRLTSDRPRLRALWVYVILETVVALAALLLPAALAAMERPLAWAYADGRGGPWFGSMRLISSLLIVGLPAAAMGATFPAGARWVVARADRAGEHVGGLYASNTVGAALGAAAAAFLLIPMFGLRGATLVGVACNVLAAGGAAWLARGARLAQSGPSIATAAAGASGRTARDSGGSQIATGGGRKNRRRTAPGAQMGGRPSLAAAALAVSGFVALVYEVAWTRILALIIGPTTYAFGAMLTTFIAGIAGGSLIGARMAARVRQPALWLGWSLIATAVAGFGVVALVGRLPLIIAEAVSKSPQEFGSLFQMQGAIVASLLLPMTLSLGVAFPLGIRVAARRTDAIPTDVAIVYAANTIGAIAGALTAGFGLIPLLGLRATVLAGGVLAIGGAVMSFMLGDVTARARRTGLIGATLTILSLLAFPPWDKELLSSGGYKYAHFLRESDLESALKAGTLLFYEEGAAGTVSVKRLAGAVSLAIDGKVDASNAGDMLTQKLLAHLPLLLHPDPKEICIIGLGSGVTLGAALRHAITRADMLEISPEVVEGSSYFANENHSALGDPRVRLILGDGRSHLLLSTRQYDIIVSEPSNPWMAGVATLFTREFFASARARLRPGGLLCQWAHTYDISEADLKSIVATFASVFPRGTIWLVGGNDLLLIGSVDAVEPLLSNIESALSRPGVAEDLSVVGVRGPFSLLSLWAGGERTLRKYGDGAIVQTDDRTALEFSAPRGIYLRGARDNAEVIQALAVHDRPAIVARSVDEATAVDWVNRGKMMMQAEAPGFASQAFDRAITLNPAHEEAVQGLVKAASTAAQRAAASSRLEALVSADPSNVPAALGLSRIRAVLGSIPQALEIAQRLTRTYPADPRPWEQLASVLADTADIQQFRPVVERLGRQWPDRPNTLYFGATLAFLEGDFPSALTLAGQAARAQPDDAKVRNLLGAVHASLGHRDEARQAFEMSLSADPRDSAALINLARLDLQAGDLQMAVDHFAQALIVDPASQAARAGLADSLDRVGESARAARIRAHSPK